MKVEVINEASVYQHREVYSTKKWVTIDPLKIEGCVGQVVSPKDCKSFVNGFGGSIPLAPTIN